MPYTSGPFAKRWNCERGALRACKTAKIEAPVEGADYVIDEHPDGAWRFALPNWTPPIEPAVGVFASTSFGLGMPSDDADKPFADPMDMGSFGSAPISGRIHGSTTVAEVPAMAASAKFLPFQTPDPSVAPEAAGSDHTAGVEEAKRSVLADRRQEVEEMFVSARSGYKPDPPRIASTKANARKLRVIAEGEELFQRRAIRKLRKLADGSRFEGPLVKRHLQLLVACLEAGRATE